MPGSFSSFVILADMRTGSNHLEALLNAHPGIDSHGEAFNPVFIGREGQETLFGVDLDGRDADPLGFLERLRAKSACLPGFRLFPGHAPRVLAASLSDRSCAKIVLTRNPLDSYISLKIARATGQWWMADAARRQTTRVRFDAEEFADDLERRTAFYDHIRSALAASGQAPFALRYTDLRDPERIAGLARFLGVEVETGNVPRTGRVQNPEPAREKVENPDEMARTLAGLDLFGLLDDPDFEPQRGPNVRTWVISDDLDCLFLPVPGGPTQAVTDWLTGAGGTPPRTGATRREVRDWLAARPGHRTFTVVSHPLARAWRAFNRHILADGPEAFTEIRGVLERRYGMVLPRSAEDASAMRTAFLAFLRFLKPNLAGQTSVRVPAVWASQSAAVRSMTEIALPSAILKEITASADLERLLGRSSDRALARFASLEGLEAIYDAEIEGAARAAYRKDYAAFGFGDWRGDQAA